MFTFFCPIQSSATIDAPHPLPMSLPTDASQRLLLTVPSPIHLHTLHGLVGLVGLRKREISVVST